MPQLMVDTNADSPSAMRRTAALIMELAAEREADDTYGGTEAMIIAPNVTVKEDTNVDTAAIFKRQPAGLDGHGEAKPAPVLLPQPSAVAGRGSMDTTPVATGPQSTGPAELDDTGLPWDERIHQKAKGKLKLDGSWKLIKGTDKVAAAAIIAELRQSHPVAASPSVQTTAAVAPPPPPQVAPPPPPATMAAQPTPVASSSVPLAPGNTAEGVTAFRMLMQKITAATAAGQLSNVQVDAALESVGLPPRQLVALVQPANASRVPGVAAYIDACLAAG